MFPTYLEWEPNWGIPGHHTAIHGAYKLTVYPSGDWSIDERLGLVHIGHGSSFATACAMWNAEQTLAAFLATLAAFIK